MAAHNFHVVFMVFFAALPGTPVFCFTDPFHTHFRGGVHDGCRGRVHKCVHYGAHERVHGHFLFT
eukprot:7761606-Lingulodinium_polyedra.AAC.1